MKALCHTCNRSNIECTINGNTGTPQCTKCLKESAPKTPKLKCICKHCTHCNPVIVAPTPMGIPEG